MPLVSTKARLSSQLSQFNTYVTEVYKPAENGTYLHAVDYREFVARSSFLNIFIAWESFLEDIFIVFMMGTQTISRLPANIFVNPRDESHAKDLIKHNNKYFDWSNPEMVVTIANLFFEDGEPFRTALNSSRSDLMDSKTIRNAAAHMTSTTQSQLNSLASRILNQSITNISVSKFLLDHDPSNPSQVIMQKYLDVFDATADLIIR